MLKKRTVVALSVAALAASTAALPAAAARSADQPVQIAACGAKKAGCGAKKAGCGAKKAGCGAADGTALDSMASHPGMDTEIGEGTGGLGGFLGENYGADDVE